MKKQLLSVELPHEQELMQPGFYVWPTGFPEENGNTVIISFSVPYPLYHHGQETKARNMKADMTIFVCQGEVLCRFLEGGGRKQLFRQGSLIYLPAGVWYQWIPARQTVFINTSMPAWKPEDREIALLTDEDKETIIRLHAC